MKKTGYGSSELKSTFRHLTTSSQASSSQSVRNRAANSDDMMNVAFLGIPKVDRLWHMRCCCFLQSDKVRSEPIHNFFPQKSWSAFFGSSGFTVRQDAGIAPRRHGGRGVKSSGQTKSPISANSGPVWWIFLTENLEQPHFQSSIQSLRSMEGSTAHANVAIHACPCTRTP